MVYMAKPRQRTPVAIEIQRLLSEAGWSVRMLREKGFSGSAAEALLGRIPSEPSLDTADRALALLGHELWHRKQR